MTSDSPLSPPAKGPEKARRLGVHFYSEHEILHKRDVVAATELWYHDVAQSPHAHEFMEIVVVKTGAAVHRMRSGASRISPGSVLVIRPGQWHAYDEPEDFRIWNLYIPTKTLSWRVGGPSEPPGPGRVHLWHRSHSPVARIASGLVDSVTTGHLALQSTSQSSTSGRSSHTSSNSLNRHRDPNAASPASAC